MFYQFKKQLHQLVYQLLPNRCVLCNKSIQALIPLCRACEADLQLPTNVFCCMRCGNYLAGTDKASVCGQCQKNPPAFDRLIHIAGYELPIKQLLLGLKFSNKQLYAPILSQLLARRVKQTYLQQSLPECIVPVPLAKRRLLNRGYNQALLIAIPLAKKLAIPLQDHLCQRVRHTLAQATLAPRERKKNMKNAFAVANHHYQHIALVDDTVTSGHTVNELANAFKKNGVSKIDVWCCARSQFLPTE